MKMTAILMLAAALQVSALGHAQNVTLKKKHASLSQVFKDIEQQTGYLFLYDDALLKLQPKVSVDVQSATLESVLRECFKNNELVFKIVRNTIVIQAKIDVWPDAMVPEVDRANPVLVTGKVVDAMTGESLADANVVIKGSQSGISSEQDGMFRVSVEPGTVLVISHVGYDPKEITAKEGGLITVRLERTKKDTLSNLVVTGFQVIRKDNFTGTATTVSGDDLKKVNPQNMLQSLQTFDPSFKIVENNLLGSNPNSLPTITVRGNTALPSSGTNVISRGSLEGASNLPTFIMDGYEVSLQKVYDLDINRVESITLLKDAAATAAYGSRAANGVVVIVTKLPKVGKLQVTYNSDLSLATPDLSGYHVLDGRQKLEYEKEAGLYDATKNGQLTQDQLDALYYHKKASVVGGVNTYWLSQPVRTAFGQRHSIFLEGGDRAVRYNLALRYQSSPGVMKGSSRDRYSTELGLSYYAGRKLIFRNTLAVTQVQAKESPYGNYADYVKANPYYEKTDSLGHIPQALDTWTDRSGSGNSVVNTTILNPMYNSTLGSFNKSSYLEFTDAFDADWNIVGGVRLKAQIALTQSRNTSDVFTSPFANAYYFTASDKLDERGEYDYGNSENTYVNGKLALNYNKQIGLNNINFVLNSSFRTTMEKSKSFTAIGFTNDRFTDIGFANQYAKQSTPSSSLNKTREMGALATLNYSWDNRFLMDATFNEDGSSQFGKEKRMAPFYSFGVGWNLHNEAFMHGSVISRLKVTASTGTSGSVNFPPYMAQTTYSYYTSNWYSTGVGAVVNNYGNTNLQWQKTNDYDAGMEIGFLRNRILIMPRYYNKLTHGLVSDVSLPPSSGYSSYKDNIGDIRNTGLELNLQVSVLKTKNWGLNLTANLARNRNKLVKISNSLKSLNDKVDAVQSDSAYKGAALLRYNEGQSLNTIYAVRSLGIDPENGRELYVKKNGTLTYDWDVKDMAAVGNTESTVEGSFGFNANYKQFYMVVFFYTRLGGEQYNQTLVDRVENADPHYNVDSRVFEAKWKQRGDHTFYKNIADLGQTQTSSRFVQRDNALELRSLYLSYDLGKSLYSKIGMTNLRLAFTTNDLWRWASIKQERGIEYPFARSFNLSIQAGF